VREIRSSIEQFDPSVAEQFDAGLARVNMVAGVDIQRDLLDPLGDQWVMYTDRTIGGPGLLGGVVINKLKDAAKADAGWAALAQSVNQMIARAIQNDDITVQFRTLNDGGLTIHYLAVPFVSPAWAVKGDNMYLALYPQIISAAARYADGHGPSITSNPAFIAVQQRLGEHKASGLSFSNLPETAGDGYQDLLMASDCGSASRTSRPPDARHGVAAAGQAAAAPGPQWRDVVERRRGVALQGDLPVPRQRSAGRQWAGRRVDRAGGDAAEHHAPGAEPCPRDECDATAAGGVRAATDSVGVCPAGGGWGSPPAAR